MKMGGQQTQENTLNKRNRLGWDILMLEKLIFQLNAGLEW